MALGINSGKTDTNTGTVLGIKYDPVAKTLLQTEIPAIEESIRQTNEAVSQLGKKVDDLQSLHNQDTQAQTQAIAENKAAATANAAAIDDNAKKIAANTAAIDENKTAITSTTAASDEDIQQLFE